MKDGRLSVSEANEEEQPLVESTEEEGSFQHGQKMIILAIIGSIIIVIVVLFTAIWLIHHFNSKDHHENHTSYEATTISVNVSTSQTIPLNRKERVESWFMPRPKRSREDYRLSGDQIPLSYDLHLTVVIKGWDNASESRVDGILLLNLKNTVDGSRVIQLNVLNIDVHDVKLTNEGKSSIPIDYYIESKIERLIIKLSHEDQFLKKNEKYTLRISYSVFPNYRMVGIYNTWHWDWDKGCQSFSLVTQNEPMDARRWIPSFDEPSYKVPLILAITHPLGTKARSNSGEKDVRLNKNARTLTTTFLPTPPLPTYLYAFTVNNYTEQHVIEDGVMLRMQYIRNFTEFKDHVLNEILLVYKTVRDHMRDVPMLLAPYQEDTRPHIKYKLDFVFIPDHSSGMENHGLIVIADRLVVRPDKFIDILVHEIVHHRFGNKLTLGWWSDFYLNEAFTAKFSSEVLAKLNVPPRWEMDLTEALRQDIYESSTPLHNPSVLSRYDAVYMLKLVYVKGQAVLRMFEKVMGKDRYEVAIKKLFNHTTVDSELLCKTLASESDSVDMPAICEDFIGMSNYPLIIVTQNATHAILRQQRFARGYVDEPYRDYSTRWTIPIFYTIGDGELKITVFNKDVETLEIPATAKIWIDPHQYGYYRTIYDDYSYFIDKDLQSTIEDNIPINKTIDDALAAYLFGYGNSTKLLRFFGETGLKRSRKVWNKHLKIMFTKPLRRMNCNFSYSDVIGLLDKTNTNKVKKPSNNRIDREEYCSHYNNSVLMEMYKKGVNLYNISERGLIVHCLVNINYDNYIDKLWMSFDPQSSDIRKSDFHIFLVPAMYASRNADQIMEDLTSKAFQFQIDTFEFVELLHVFFDPMQTVITNRLVSVLVKLKGDAMAHTWNLMARIVEEERLVDLDLKKRTPRMISEMASLIREKKGIEICNNG